MSRWRQFARTLKERSEPRADSANCADSPVVHAIGTNGANGTGLVAAISALPRPIDPADWNTALATINASRAPAGFDPDRWRYLVTDARWLCRYHGPAAAALGWTASDLFGLALPNGIGGLADRLEGTRNLVLTDRIAHWRGADLEGWLWRETMRPMSPLWAMGA